LHGERDTCFVCDGPVEQVEMVEVERRKGSAVRWGLVLAQVGALIALIAWEPLLFIGWSVQIAGCTVASALRR
jgi:hypothetical protein